MSYPYTPDPTSYSVPAQQLHPPAPPFTPPMALPPAPPPLFPNLQACVDATRSVCGSTSAFTAAAHECLYPQQSPRPSSLLPPPPPLIRAPVQLSMPFMYAPMYLPCSTQQTQEGQEAGQEKDSTSIPFLLVFVKGNISRCAGCGKKTYEMAMEKCTPLHMISASCTRSSSLLRIPTLEYAKSLKREGMFTTMLAKSV